MNTDNIFTTVLRTCFIGLIVYGLTLKCPQLQNIFKLYFQSFNALQLITKMLICVQLQVDFTKTASH